MISDMELAAQGSQEEPLYEGSRSDGYARITLNRGASSASSSESGLPWYKRVRFWGTCVVSAAVLIVLIMIIALFVPGSARNGSLEGAVNVNNIFAHLQQFQSIASSSNGTRYIAGPGFNSTVKYILSQLSQTSLIVRTQWFPVQISTVEDTPTFFITSTNDSYAYQRDFNFIQYTGRGDVDSTSISIPSYGCQESDYKDKEVNNKIAIIRRGVCTFQEKLDLAVKKGASAVIIYNNENNMFSGTLSSPASIPVLAVPLLLGRYLSISQPSIHLSIFPTVSTTYVCNIFADTPSGDNHNIIVIGAHSDSVSKGPGINDNGSGAATVLEMAIQSSHVMRAGVKNLIRFAFFAAEEEGLIGSKYYVEHLDNSTTSSTSGVCSTSTSITPITCSKLSDHAVNLNFDMVASPNFVYGINAVDNVNASTYTHDTIHGSNKIRQLFIQEFDKRGLKYRVSEMNGRSDYADFMKYNISASGLDTGAEGMKTEDERLIWGGLTNAAYDPCYHQSCDTIDNVNKESLGNLAKIAAAATQTLATSSDLRGFLRSP